MIHIKVHKSYKLVVAMCDSNLLGKKFEQDKLQLDLVERFYKGEELSFEEAKKHMEKHTLDDATFNIVGEEAIKAAMETGIIEQAHIGKIDNIPYTIAI